MRVLSVAHTAVDRAAGRLRYHPLRDRPDVDCHLLVPATWQQFGRRLVADPADDPGVTMHIKPIRWGSAGPAKWYLHFYPAMRRLIRALRPDVIHLWEEPWSVVALQAAMLRDLYAPAASLVLEVDQNILKQLPPPFETMRRYVLRRTDRILARSEPAIDVVRASGFAGPAETIGYGVDQGVFRPGDDRQAVRTALGLEGFTIGYVGRLVVEKGLDDALDAIAALPRHVTLVLLGEGPHRERLLGRAASLGIADRLKILPWGPPVEVARLMRALDVLVLLTRTTGGVREQFGRVIIEAQSCGVPVIGSSCGAIPGIVGDGGWIVPERDPAALAALLDGLMNDPQRLAAAAAAGLHQVAARYTYDVVAEQLRIGWEASRASRAGRT